MAKFFEVDESWEGSLEKELDEQIDGIKTAAGFALNAVGTEMVESLQRHIRNDVYLAYDPIAYPRRSVNSAFGTPLISEDYMDPHVDPRELKLAFTYKPMGYHSGKRKDALNYKPPISGTDEHADDPLKPHPFHGDELIEIIQTAGYDWAMNDPVPPRPFWNRFVDEQFNGGIMAAFEYGFAGRGYEFNRQGGNSDFIYAAQESMLAAQENA